MRNNLSERLSAGLATSSGLDQGVILAAMDAELVQTTDMTYALRQPMGIAGMPSFGFGDHPEQGGVPLADMPDITAPLRDTMPQ